MNSKNLLARIIQNAQQTVRLGLEKVEAARVVKELNVCPFNSFAFVFLLLVFEDVLE